MLAVGAGLTAACNLVTGASDLVIADDAGGLVAPPDATASQPDATGDTGVPPEELENDADPPREVDAGVDTWSPPIPRATDGGYLRVFLTSSTVRGDAVSDTVCQAYASDGGLGGTWKAWIATSTENAATHVKGNGPWLLLDGTTVAPSRQQLLGGTLVNPIERNEKNFKMAGHIHVWTGALPNGNLAGTNCNDWRATTGNARAGYNAKNAQWTDHISPGCTAGNRLYCFEQ